MLLKIFQDRFGLYAFALAVVILVPHPVSALAADQAQPLDATPPAIGQPVIEPTAPDWSLIIGAGGMLEPSYEGSDELEASPLPFVLFNYGDWLEINPSGASVTVFRHDGFSLSGSVGYETGRDTDDHDRLRGLSDIDFAATVGAQAAYEWGPVEIYGEVERTIEGSESLLGTLGVGYSAPVSERLVLGASAEAIVADDNHMDAYFSVDAGQSAASGLSQYDAEAGLKRVNLSASATYLVNENWLVGGEAQLGVLTGDAADSPIVEETLQPSLAVFLGYRF